MLRIRLHTDRPDVWRDAARRLQRAEFAADDAPSGAVEAELFDGAARAKPQAMLQALSAGRHVLLAAEPCLTADELEALAAAAAKNSVTFRAVNPDRLLPSRQLIQSQLGAALGSPELVRIHRWQPHATAPATTPLELPALLVAEIEQALWLVDRPTTRVFALERVADAGRYLQVHLSFDPGMALIDYDDRIPDGAGYRSLSVIGSSGSAQIDDQADTQLAYRGGAPQAVVVDEGVRYLATLVDDFAAAVAERRDVAAERNAWRDVTTVVADVRRALEVGNAVTAEER